MSCVTLATVHQADLSSLGRGGDVEARLETLRWPRRGPVCPHCGARHAYRMVCERSGGVRFKCARCRKPYSARRGTVLERSNVATVLWLRAMALFLDDPGRGLPARIQRTCGVSYKTAWSMARRLRAAPNDPILQALRQEQAEIAPSRSDSIREWSSQ